MLRVFGLLASLFLACDAVHAADWIEPGEKVSLSSGEGLAVLMIDSDQALQDVFLDREGSAIQWRIGRLAPGRHLRVFALAEGTYRFRSISFEDAIYRWAWKFDDRILDAAFTVEAGKINYFGDVISRGLAARMLTVDNRSAGTMMELERHYPELIGRYPWRYAGTNPDSFVTNHLSARLAASTTGGAPVELQSAPLAEPNVAERDTASIYFRPPEVLAVALAPSGEHFVEQRVDGLVHRTVVVRVSDLREYAVFSGNKRHRDLEWLDSRRLVLTVDDNGAYASHLVTLPEGEGKVRTDAFKVKGFVLAVTRNPGEVLFMAKEGRPRHGLFRVKADHLITDRPLKGADRLHAGEEGSWWTDQDGEARLVQLSEKEDDRTIYRYFPKDGKSVDFSLDEDVGTLETIAGFDADGRLLLMTNRQREQRDLVVFDPATSSIRETVFSEPGNDVKSVVGGDRRVIESVVVMRRGRLHTVPLTKVDRKYTDAISKALPNRNLTIHAPGKNGARLVLASTATDPGTWYLYHPEARRLEAITRIAPHLEGRKMATLRRLVAKAPDGFEIESFLTVADSDSTSPKPLLVLIHGGPIGAYDAESFDPEAHYFAQLGWAVLQVNYRGSGNTPISSRPPALGYVGQAIESDIDAAVDHVMTVAAIDTTKIAASGGSYGGYSALMLTLKRPDRYRAAVTVAGVADLPLMFSSGDMAWHARAMNHWTKLLGDPVQNAEKLKELSPSHQAERLTRPILIVHDRNDFRVPFEHARRLQMALRQEGRPAGLIAVDDHQHGMFEPLTQLAVYPRMAAFLRTAVLESTPAP